ncbi:hypothetical protein RMATCC62417_03832 [Rhizopus microsporus]|nr:hypothetical protein RMATCC62417_03832 [Rhizopus microsporus]
MNAVPFELRISQAQSTRLLRSFTAFDLQEVAKRCPTHSNSGLDGIPYQVLALIFHHATTSTIAVHVYNDALSGGSFPSS